MCVCVCVFRLEKEYLSHLFQDLKRLNFLGCGSNKYQTQEMSKLVPLIK